MNSYSSYGFPQSGTSTIEGDITSNGRKFLIGNCVKCSRKTSMSANDKTNIVEGLVIFSKLWEKLLVKQVKN